MAMTTIHVQDVLKDIAIDDSLSTATMLLPLGAGAVDPDLIAPHDEQEHQHVEELIAFRCSCI